MKHSMSNIYSGVVFKLVFLTGFYLLVKGLAWDGYAFYLITAIVLLVLGLKATAEVFGDLSLLYS